LYTARHTLCGEISQPDSETSMETKFHVFNSYVIMSTMFGGPWMGAFTKFSLSIIVNRTHLQRYLVLHRVVEDRLFQLVSKLKALLNKNPKTALEAFGAQLGPFITNLENLFIASLPSVNFTQTLFFEGSQTHECLARAVTSHLQSHGCTVVLGDDTKLIDMFVDSLSLFLMNSVERQRSSHVIQGRGYTPDLILQGVVGGSLSDEEVIQSLLPTTLVDLNTNIVKQTHPFHEYTVLRREFMNLELEKILSSKRKDNLWTAQEGLFRIVKASAPVIDKILLDVFSLPTSLREEYIAESMRLLTRKAALLIKYVEAELEKGQCANLEASIVKKIRFDLDIASEADFSVLLGIAEKLEPGIYIALAGDPASIEEKFVELFESF